MTKLRSESMIELENFNIYKYVSENYGSMASVDDNGDINVIATMEGSGWGNHTSIQNAEYLIGRIKEDEFNDIELLK